MKINRLYQFKQYQLHIHTPPEREQSMTVFDDTKDISFCFAFDKTFWAWGKEIQDGEKESVARTRVEVDKFLA